MSKHTRALKQAERDYVKANKRLELLQTEYNKVQESFDNTNKNEELQIKLDSLNEQIEQAQLLQRKAKSKVAEAEMFVMRNKY
tara:strand:+ start:298 stop:546 length:249 start_codon:yes stop_codon:yes gene_type:complete